MTASAAVAKEINPPAFRTSTTTRLGMTQCKTFFVTPLNRHAAFFAVVFYPHFENCRLSFAQMCNGNLPTKEQWKPITLTWCLHSLLSLSTNQPASTSSLLWTWLPWKRSRRKFLSWMDYESYQHFAAIQIMILFLTMADGQIILKGTIV